MSAMGDYTNIILERLETAQAQEGNALAGVTILVEDANDLQNKIDTAIGSTGALVLIGMPNGQNTGASTCFADLQITSQLAVAENPVLWRDTQDKPTCLDFVQAIMTALQGLSFAGFSQELHVSDFVNVKDKSRQLYNITVESKFIVQPTQ